MTAYRTNTAPPPATRPALTRWQRAVVAMLGEARCARFAWFRAHVGGRWAFGPMYVGGDLARAWGHCLNTRCPEEMDWRRCEAGIAGTGCSCEVYPWPSLYTRQTPEEARSFEEFRQWYEGVRVVDLSRAGKAKR